MRHDPLPWQLADVPAELLIRPMAETLSLHLRSLRRGRAPHPFPPAIQQTESRSQAMRSTLRKRQPHPTFEPGRSLAADLAAGQIQGSDSQAIATQCAHDA
jgi:hypothetical protein